MKKPAKRPRKCCARGCRNPAQFFGPRIGLKKQLCWCSDECGLQVAKAAQAKKAAANAKADRAAHRQRKIAIQRPSDVRPGTQDDFNAMIRERDFFEPCISCDRYDHEVPEHPTGGKWDCGHFLTRGAHPELAFEPLNAHKQCKHCNRDRSGNATRYEENLIKRIGADKVAWLKGKHEPKKYTAKQLREMAAAYRAEKRRMQREREAAAAKLQDWRFDFCAPDIRLAVEVEGGAWTGGRHTRGAGFSGDLRKYGAAMRLGWTVYRCDYALIRSGEAYDTIKVLCKQHAIR